MGLASCIYQFLILQKCSVLVSGHEQYPNEKILWQRIAKESKHLAVYVFDCEYDAFYPFTESKRIAYDGVNIPDDEIWSKTPSEENYDFLMVAEVKVPPILA